MLVAAFETRDKALLQVVRVIGIGVRVYDEYLKFRIARVGNRGQFKIE